MGIYNGSVTLVIYTMKPKELLNLLWENGVELKDIKYIDSTTMTITIKNKDKKIFKVIIDQGIDEFEEVRSDVFSEKISNVKKRIAFLLGAFVFCFLIYYYSTYIWTIEINDLKNTSPFEIREILKAKGIEIGVSKKKINFNEIEEEIVSENKNIAWVNLKAVGSKLIVEAAERAQPPEIKENKEYKDILASKDGEIVRIYTTGGTASVKPGDMVRKGQILISANEGKEGNVYDVEPKGVVIAKTFYEEFKRVEFKELKKERTGKFISDVYIKIGSKKIYVKNSVNKFDKYDKIEEGNFFIHKDTFYELEEKSVKIDEKEVIDKTINELTEKINLELNKNIKVLDRIVDKNYINDSCVVRVLTVCEENISISD